MSATYISAALRRAVRERACGRCEYCGIPDDATLAPHEADHVIGEQHGGATSIDNLEILPLTLIGKGTVMLLHMNDEQRIALRAELLAQSRLSPPQP